MRTLPIFLTFLALAAPAGASDWADATPTAWHQLARAESLLSAPEPPEPVAVCVVDSGVNLTPDLAPVVIERLAYDGGDPGDTYPQEGIDDGHGTYVATFLAGQVNGWGGAGLWPRAKIVSVRVFPPGRVRARADDYIEGLRICRQHPQVRVINLSLGDIDASEDDLAELEARINYLRHSRDLNIVAAAGNRGGDLEVPAAFEATFAVGGIDASGALCAFSARGEGLDLVAPGCALVGADQRGGRAFFAGTSFAAPMVSAALASLRAYHGLSAAEAEQQLLRTARHSGAGPVLDVETALAPAALGWRRQSGEPMQPQAAESSAPAIQSDFLDYPRPRTRVRRSGTRSTLVIVLNKPDGVGIEVRRGSLVRETARDRIRVPRKGRARIRFISDYGCSPWTDVKLAESP